MAARGGGAPCGACKFLRRKCVEGCVFAPYFVTEELGAAHFAAIHKVFGASNFSKLLHNIQSEEERFDAVVSVAYEAQARLHDPINGCVSHIFALQQQVAHLQGELASAYSKLAGSSDGTLMSPSHVNRKQGDIQLSFVNNAYMHYNSINEPQTSHQRILENTMTSTDDKDSCFPTQPINVPQENITSMEGSLDDIGDLEALVCSLLRKNTS